MNNKCPTTNVANTLRRVVATSFKKGLLGPFQHHQNYPLNGGISCTSDSFRVCFPKHHAQLVDLRVLRNHRSGPKHTEDATPKVLLKSLPALPGATRIRRLRGYFQPWLLGLWPKSAWPLLAPNDPYFLQAARHSDSCFAGCASACTCGKNSYNSSGLCSCTWQIWHGCILVDPILACIV